VPVATNDTSDDIGLIPPNEALYDGSSTAEEFVRFGELFCNNILIPRGHVTPTASLLDIGCGNGAVARALTRVLTPPGRYEGLDIKLASVTWLQQQYRPFPHFHFTHADVVNSAYNPGGRYQPQDFRLPFPEASFDVVLLKSVFTHMRPAEVRSYLMEVGRVLKRSGRAVVTYFLLNRESLRFIGAGGGPVPMNFPYKGDPLCRVMTPDLPESAIAHDEQRIRQYHEEARLTPIEITFGNWCGRPAMIGLQDLIVSLKE
jgi:SAM-dependent methyltransferase